MNIPFERHETWIERQDQIRLQKEKIKMQKEKATFAKLRSKRKKKKK